MLIPRIDRYATLFLFYPLMRRWRSAGLRIPILMYHSVSDDRDATMSAYYQTTTTPAVFEEQMRLLSESNYSAISIDEAVTLLESGVQPEGKPVVLTFDDGYMDFYTSAFPVIQEYGFSATVFLSTGFIGNHPMRFNGRACMSWDMVRSLSAFGIAFGSHTVSHPQLKSLVSSEVEIEIRRSKEAIEDRTGLPVTSFSYPFAFPEELKGFKERLRAALVDAGYRNGVSTIVGTAGRGDDMFFLRRIPVNLFDDVRLFRAKLAGGYDWVHEIQYTSKVIKSKVN